MSEVARCNTIEVGQPVLRTGSKIEARDQVEQALIGAIRNRDRQRFLVKSLDVAADQRAQQPAQGPLPGLLPNQGFDFLLEGVEGPQAVMLLRKPRVQVVHVSLFKSWKKLRIYTVGQGFAPW
ncbi:hypothetical protein KIP88_26570 [Bradyrhizobium sp. SRL28]|nr:hypothetical protein [Bradyrhizobium sp. SRL28]